MSKDYQRIIDDGFQYKMALLMMGDTIIDLLTELNRNIKIMTETLDDDLTEIEGDVTALTTQVTSSVTEIQSLAAQLSTLTSELATSGAINPTQSARIAAIHLALTGEASALAGAVTAATPAPVAPVEPTPAPVEPTPEEPAPVEPAPSEPTATVAPTSLS